MAMSRDEVQDYMLKLLKRVAPEVKLDRLRLDRNLKKEIDLDSLDFLKMMVIIEKEKGYSVPETDYHLLFTINGMVSYFEGKI